MLWLRLRPEPRLPGERPPPPGRRRLNRTATILAVTAVDAGLVTACSSLRRRRRRAVQPPPPPLRGTFPRIIAAGNASGSGICSRARSSGGCLAHGV